MPSLVVGSSVDRPCSRRPLNDGKTERDLQQKALNMSTELSVLSECIAAFFPPRLFPAFRTKIASGQN